MYRSSQALGLGFRDTGRWLWSYYSSRLPNADSRLSHELKIAIRDGDGRSQRLTIRTNGFDWMVVEEVFLRKVYEVKLKNVDRILDLGGNIGLATLYFARLHPHAQICTVEPIAENVTILKKNVRLNRSSVRVVTAAVGAQDGKAKFALSADPRQHSVIPPETKAQDGQRIVEIDVLSVPSLMRLMGWGEFDLLKIDIEGSEKEVLANRPSWLKNVRAIIGEGHLGVNYRFEEARRDLEPMGFEVEKINENSDAVLFYAKRRE